MATANEFHHLVRVLRRKVGDPVIVICPQTGKEIDAVIETINSSSVSLRLVGDEWRTTSGPARVHLIIGLIQPKLLDLIVEKATELQVSAVSIFGGKKSKLPTLSSDRRERLVRLAEAAAKQSGANSIPIICHYESLAATLEQLHETPNSELATPTSRFLCSLRTANSSPELAVAILDYVANYRQSLNISNPTAPPPDTQSSLQPRAQNDEVYLVVGPESGLTEEEEELAISRGYCPVSLGSSTLRVETAAITATAITAALLRCSK